MHNLSNRGSGFCGEFAGEFSRFKSIIGKERQVHAMRPLADELRPTSLEEICGQEHILGQGAILRRIIESGETPQSNLFLWTVWD